MIDENVSDLITISRHDLDEIVRQPILDDTVELMTVKDKFGLTVHVSSEIYKKHLLDA